MVFFQLFLSLFNMVLAIGHYYNGSVGSAIFSSFVAGFCLALSFAIFVNNRASIKFDTSAPYRKNIIWSK